MAHTTAKIGEQNLSGVDQSLAGEPIGEDEDNKQDDEADQLRNHPETEQRYEKYTSHKCTCRIFFLYL